MRSISLVALVLLISACASVSLSAEGKGKDTSTGKWPTEIAGKDLDKWIGEIKDADPAIRHAAVRTVVQFGPAAQKALLPLAARLLLRNETDAAVRADAAIAIRVLLQPEKKVSDPVINALAEALGDSQRTVRREAATALAQIGPEAKGAISKLVSTLQDPMSWELRHVSARALAAVAHSDKGPDPTAVNAFISTQVPGGLGTVSDPCASVRLEVITALSMLGTTEKLRPAEKMALEDRLRKEQDHRVKIWVRLLLMMMDEKGHMTKPNFDALVADLESDDAGVRVQAAQALGTLGKMSAKQPGVATALTKALFDKELEVRLAAIRALPRLGPDCVPVLTKLLKDEKEDMAVRTQVAHAAALLGKDGKPLMDELTSLLTHKDVTLVTAAIEGLAAFGEVAQPAVPALKKYDPETLSFDAHIKEVTAAASEEATRMKHAVKDAADEAAKHINDSRSPKK
jgi:HEAT repeat protein